MTAVTAQCQGATAVERSRFFVPALRNPCLSHFPSHDNHVLSFAGTSGVKERLYRNPGESEGDAGYHFICECFFLTARALHLGPVKAVSQLERLQQQTFRVKDEMGLAEVELGMTQQGTFRHRELSMQVRSEGCARAGRYQRVGEVGGVR